MEELEKVEETKSVDEVTDDLEKKKEEYEEEVIAEFKLDFDMLEDYKDKDNEDIPICSILHLYQVAGIEPKIREYINATEGVEKIVALDNLKCNFATLIKMRNLIRDNWSMYSISIDADNHVFWDESTYKKGVKHYAKTLSAKVRNSMNADFSTFCPGLDPDVGDDVIVFKVYHKGPKKTDETEETKTEE